MRKLIAVAGVVVILVLFALKANAQNYASVTGIVTDSTGAVISGANVVPVNTATPGSPT